jgi:AraC-like DNA-binding protein
MLLAAAQGILLTLLILYKYRKLYANRFLGALLSAYSLILLTLLYGDLGHTEFSLTVLFIGLGFLVAPLHYWYAKHLVFPKTRFHFIYLIHMLPFFIYEGYAFLDLFFLQGRWIANFSIVENIPSQAGFVAFNWAILLQMAIYMIISIKMLRRYSRYIKDVFSSIDRIRMSWLRNISFLAISAISVFFLENLFLLYDIQLSHNFNLSSFLVAAYVYIIGYLGIFKSEVFSLENVEAALSRLPELSYQSKMDSVQVRPEGEKYERSGLSEEKAKAFLDNLLRLMREKEPYVDVNLTLNQMAEMLSISSHNLSEILNVHLHQNFYDFINGYRVERVKADLLNPLKGTLKILAIAYDAGFNSKSSFNNIFKKFTGMTPSEYRQTAKSSQSADQPI